MKALMERVMARIEVDGECWVWTGAKSAEGYGNIATGSVKDGSRRCSRVHRVTWEHFNGPIPDGRHLHHLCNAVACCNPAHLETITAAEHQRLHAATITHCPQGHPYAGDNLYVNPSSRKRFCRTCNRQRCARYYLRRTGRAAA